MGKKFDVFASALIEQLGKNGDNATHAASALGIPDGTARKWRLKLIARGEYSPKFPEASNGQANDLCGFESEKAMRQSSILCRDNSNDLLERSGSKFSEKEHKSLLKHKRFVITSVQNDTAVNEDFYAALKVYCSTVGARLLVVPIRYMFSEKSSVFRVDDDDLFFENVNLGPKVKLLSRLNVLPTIVDPFAGLDPLSKGHSVLIPHPQVAMKTMATIGGAPAQMHTTGSLNVAKGAYAKNKTGHKAEFNHSNAALVLEVGEGDSFFVRTLNCDDDGGFYDCPEGFEGYFSKNGFEELKEQIAGIYLGDSHMSVADEDVIAATFTNKDSILNVLKPLETVHGDLFDSQSVSHHDEHDYLTRWGKKNFGLDSLEAEFDKTFELYSMVMPDFTVGIIDASNHNDHVYKYLTTADPRRDLVNAKIYHKLNYLLLANVENTPSGPRFPNLLELWLNNSKFAKLTKNMRFLGRRRGYQICGIEVSMHGDKGPNGAKGSPIGFSRLPMKCIVGHSHTPSIRLGCYTVGTSSRMDLSYTGGPSSWMHTHCVIYKNGKRQMISIINGKWRLTGR